MGVTEQLARMVVETPGEALDGEVVESAKLRFLDMLGIALAGSRERSTLIALDIARHMGGEGRASIPGHPDRTSAPLAGFVTGIAAHSQEFDDYTKGVTHVSVAMVPGALALAEDMDLSGRAMIEGFALGFELESRIGHGLRPALFDRGWHPNGILGALGVAAAGIDVYATDAVMAKCMGFEPMTLGLLAYANDLDLGVADLEKIDVLETGISDVARNFKPHETNELQLQWQDADAGRYLNV